MADETEGKYQLVHHREAKKSRRKMKYQLMPSLLNKLATFLQTKNVPKIDDKGKRKAMRVGTLWREVEQTLLSQCHGGVSDCNTFSLLSVLLHRTRS